MTWPDGTVGFRIDGDVEREDYTWRRSAIVTDIDWMARASKLFLWLFPGEARLFRVADLEQAKAWVASLDPIA